MVDEAALAELGRLGLLRAAPGAQVEPALELLRAVLGAPALALYALEDERLVRRRAAGEAPERLPLEGAPGAALLEDAPVAEGGAVAVQVSAPGEQPPWGALCALGPVDPAALAGAARLLGCALWTGGALDPEGGHAAVDGGRLASVARLTAAVVHELNNLAMSVNGHAQLARRRTAEGDLVRRELGSILDAGRSAQALAARLHPPQPLGAAPGPAEADALARAVVDAVAPTPGARVALRTDAPGAAALVDPARLETVLHGLVRNARAASAAEAEVQVDTARVELDPAAAAALLGAARPGWHVRLRVTDAGRGLPPGALAHAFEPYAGRGMRQGGLGLWCTWQLAAAHAGGVRLVSRPGRTVVELFLPCDPPAPAGRALLVVGPAAFRRSARAALAPRGITVREAADEAAARALVAAGGVDQALVSGRSGSGEALAGTLPPGSITIGGAGGLRPFLEDLRAP